MIVKKTFGTATLYCGDCKDVLPTLEGVNVIVTDPPYLMDVGSGTQFAKRKYLTEVLESDLNNGFDISVLDSAPEWLCFCAKSQLTILIEYAEGRDLRWMVRTWCKTNPTPLVNNTYKPDTEYMVHGFRGHNYEGKNRFVLGPIVKNSYDHPTVKPLYVMVDALRCSTHNGDVVLDPFMGTGTTGVACLELGRKFIGIEKDPKHFKIACERIENTHSQGMLW